MTQDVTTVTQQALYEQVWSMPMTKLAKEYGVSDVALRKACRKANIPLPVQGHWNKPSHVRTKARRPPLSFEGSNRPYTISITRSPPARPAEESHPAIGACAQALASGETRIQVDLEPGQVGPARPSVVYPGEGTTKDCGDQPGYNLMTMTSYGVSRGVQ